MALDPGPFTRPLAGPVARHRTGGGGFQKRADANDAVPTRHDAVPTRHDAELKTFPAEPK